MTSPYRHHNIYYPRSPAEPAKSAAPASASNKAPANGNTHKATSTTPAKSKTTSHSGSNPTTSAGSKAASGGVSSGAVAGIAAAICIIALIAIGFGIRWWLIRKRRAKRQSWSKGFQSNLEAKRRSQAEDANGPPTPLRPLMTEKPLAPFPGDMTPTPSPGFPPNRFGDGPERPMSSNSHPNSELSSLMVPDIPPSPSVASTAVGPRHETCIVRITFRPSLPDELPVTMGETITLLTAFNDGWGACMNANGEQGVVPLDCLSRGGVEKDYNEGGVWRLSKRASSMYQAS